MFDSHIHTKFSKDSNADGKELCLAAQNIPLDGICFTDHCSLLTCVTDNAYRTVLNSSEYAKEQSAAFPSLTVTRGAEFSGVLYKADYFERILKNIPLDCVLISVHRIFDGCMHHGLSHIDFGALSMQRTEEIAHIYFNDLFKTLSSFDFDICAHLTLPLRYINGVYHKGISLVPFTKDIERILGVIIDKKKALEINTSELDRQLFDFMPSKEVLKLYRNMDGTLISTGSDAHLPENVGHGFLRAKALLKEFGFKSTVYYKERKSIEISL